MPSLQIRHLPEDIYQALAHRAEMEGRSLAQQAIAELRSMNELVRRSQRLEVIEQLREELARGSAVQPLSPSPEQLIRADRDR